MILKISFLTVLVSTNALAANKVSDEASLNSAIAMANADSSINTIVFERNAQINLTAPVIYTGSQNLTLLGNDATVDGTNAGSFVIAPDLSVITTDATLIFNTAGDITIRKLSIVNSATHGIVIKIPNAAQGDDIQVSLHKVNILDSALYGLYIDDTADEFTASAVGSEIGIELVISQSNIIGNGTGATDFDGIRVDEREQGDLYALISDSHFDANGGDGLELDERGEGNVDVTMKHVTFNDNGFFDINDFEDGLDIDEEDGGNIEASLFRVEASGNMDEGLDFDEEGEGNVELKLRRIIAMDNEDEGIKIDEEDAGDIEAKLFKVKVIGSNDDGIQFSEIGEGRIDAKLNKVTATDNSKYGVKIEQWFIEDEELPVEDAGALKIKKLSLSGNGNGDELKLQNMTVK